MTKNIYICLFLLFIASPKIYSKPENYYFEHLPLGQGLPHSIISSIVQDNKGFIWFGTGDGLVKYDGHSYLVYKNDPEDPASLNNNIIKSLSSGNNNKIWIATSNCLYSMNIETNKFTQHPFFPENKENALLKKILCDSKNNVWIGTEDGLFYYNTKNKTVKKYVTDLNNSNSLSSSNIETLYEDSDSILWIGTTSGLDLYYPKKDLFIRLPQSTLSKNSKQLYGNGVKTIREGANKKIWIGNNYGYSSYSKETKEFTNYTYAKFQLENITNSTVTNIYSDKNDRVWIGTVENGIYVYDQNNGRTTNHTHIPYLPSSLSSNYVYVFFADKYRNLWIGTVNGGVDKINFERKKFNTMGYYPGVSNSLNDKIVTSIYEDSNGNLWVGTWSGGVNRIYPDRNKIVYYKHEPGHKNSIGAGIVGGICEDNNGNIWLVTWQGIVNMINPISGEVKSFKGGAGNPVSGWSFRTIYFDSKNRLWLGSLDKGLELFDIEKGVTKPYYQNNSRKFNNLIDNDLQCIYEDSKGTLWLGTSIGLFSLDLDREIFKSYIVENHTKGGLQNNSIKCVYEDSQNRLWVGTEGAGLQQLIRETGEFKRWSTKNGLSNNNVYGIYDDMVGNLWISTSHGVSQFDQNRQSFRNYYEEDGLQSNEFKWGAHHLNNEGVIYFGGLNGLTWFHPDSIRDNPVPPNIVITEFSLFNFPINAGDTVNHRCLLKYEISSTKSILLKYNENEFSFRFSALHYGNTSKEIYMYKLEGYDNQWNKTGTNQRIAKYTNIEPGKYNFIVKAANSDGIWCKEPAQVKIFIRPPFWKTLFFKVFLVVLIIILFIMAIRVRTFYLERQKAILSNLVEQRTFELEGKNLELEKRQEQIVKQAELLHEKDQIKLNFFTNISHEFRTPLTLLHGPLDLLLKPDNKLSSERIKYFYAIMKRNVQRLLRLINQVLDTSQLDAGALQLRVAKGDVMKHLRIIYESFKFVAEQKKITYSFRTDYKEVFCYFDHDKLEKIAYNLLSNAFKYTPEKGSIEVIVTVSNQRNEKKELEIKVSDSGIGIPENKLEHIFELYYQGKTSREKLLGGSGIGLSLAKRLARLHKGDITVKSSLNRGTIFTVSIPVSSISYSEKEYAQSYDYTMPSELNMALTQPVKELNNLDQNENEVNKEPQNMLPTVLVVEDNIEVLDFLEEMLKRSYNVILATNGANGLKLAFDNLPDIIISDIMMPIMDGIELCSKIKTDLRTCHIPIILLTAKGTVENTIEGLDIGADDYVIKPFNFDILKSRIKNLLDSRRNLKALYRAELIKRTENVVDVPVEGKITIKLSEFIEKNIGEADYSIEHICRELAISRTQLYRKLQTEANMSVNQFIQYTKLKIASGMLLGSELRISEISYKIGFKYTNHFTKLFRQKYGFTPSQYRKQKK